jgi:hypothetical protein
VKEITFILPTKNRFDVLKNFISHHEKILKNLNYKFLIVDGSNPYIHKKIKKICRKKKKLNLIKQTKKGFMNACFQSIKKIKTEYCTFLYDDDLLSIEAIKVFKKTLNNKFSMGYGIVENLNNQNIQTKSNFNKIKIRKYKNEDLLLAYYGENKLGVPFMPVSPICLIFKSNFLNYWKKYLIKFCKRSKFRKYFLLKQNIGPDLIIYLLQILKHNHINFSKPHIAKFNEHEDSMSYLLGMNKLQIGYWLAKKSIFENNLIINKQLIIKAYTFLYTAGIFILIKNIILKFFGKDNYYSGFRNEIKILKNHKNAEFSLFECINIILNKIIIKIKN